MSACLGIDIGGANLKYADLHGKTLSREFPMWRRHRELSEQLIRDMSSYKSIASLAITMTGELADCFEDRQDGVHQIIDAVEAAASSVGIPRVAFFAIRKGFLNNAEAKMDVDHVAASNWFALASYVAEEIAADALLIDIGSTTTDIVPIVNGRVGTQATTDYDRLVEGSLVYVGCERTPVCSLLSTVEHRGNQVGVMNEFFATVDDARIVLSLVGESNETDTADARPRTKEFASARLARMIGLDHRSFTNNDATSMAQQIVDSVTFRISESLVRMDPKVGCYVFSGHGPDLLPKLPVGKMINLVDRLGPELSRCAPSFAVASLYAKAIGIS